MSRPVSTRNRRLILAWKGKGLKPAQKCPVCGERMRGGLCEACEGKEEDGDES